ncbi:endonuclease VII domain-containing protein [Nocardioides aquiterrae]
MSAKPGLCKSCSSARTRAWRDANPDEWERHRRRSYLKQKYGITPEQYDEILAAQGGVCAICGDPPADSRGYRMHVDHCHSTGRVRGILCGPCNRGLGNFADNPTRLLAAVDYLHR